MKNNVNYDLYTDEELIEKYSVQINGRRFVPSVVLRVIGTRKAKRANRQPGDPGTKENPIFKYGKAYVYDSTDKLILWEDYDGLVPVGNGITVNINPKTMESFTLTKDMKPTEKQKQMIQEAGKRKVVFTADSPKSSPEQLRRFRRNGERRIKESAKRRTLQKT